MGHVERSLQVDVENCVHLIEGHVGERLVPEDPRVVDHDVDRPEGIQCGLDDALAALTSGNRVVIGHRFPARSRDLLHHQVGGGMRSPAAVDGATEVVDHDHGPSSPQLQGVLPPQATSGSGDHRHPPVERDRLTHLLTPSA